jgi:hypothetical protein
MEAIYSDGLPSFPIMEFKAVRREGLQPISMSLLEPTAPTESERAREREESSK